MKTHVNSVWNASASVRSTYAQDGGVLLDVEKGMCYSLNPVATKLWNYLEQNQGGVTFNDLVKEIRSNFEVSDGELETDIAALGETRKDRAGPAQRSRSLEFPPGSGKLDKIPTEVPSASRHFWRIVCISASVCSWQARPLRDIVTPVNLCISWGYYR